MPYSILWFRRATIPSSSLYSPYYQLNMLALEHESRTLSRTYIMSIDIRHHILSIIQGLNVQTCLGLYSKYRT